MHQLGDCALFEHVHRFGRHVALIIVYFLSEQICGLLHVRVDGISTLLEMTHRATGVYIVSLGDFVSVRTVKDSRLDTVGGVFTD